jgi:hypothetical protein
MSDYWSYRIYRSGYDGSQVFVAEYIAETSPEAVRADLASKHSHLQGYLKQLFGIDERDYSRKFALRAEALLGALVATMDCSLRFGMWLPVQAPPARHIPAPSELGQPSSTWNGVRLWLRQTGDTEAYA